MTATMSWKSGKRWLCLALCLLAFAALGNRALAAPSVEGTGNYWSIYAAGSYHNWDGVSIAAQFPGPNGQLYYAVDTQDQVNVFKTRDGKPLSGVTALKKTHPIFGTVVCDRDGNYYLVTGETNTTDDTSVETVFISKYDKNGKLLQTTGDNGSSSLASYYGASYHTRQPFEAGTCEAAISGRILSVHYAREMYSGHQSNSVFSVNIDTMEKVNTGVFYESHSFAQRVAPTADGFVYMSEGDCYDRGFTTFIAKMSGNSLAGSRERKIFDFWVQDGALEAYDMYVLNENFAHMGGLGVLSDGRVAFAAQSARSLNGSAAQEREDIFLQIFNYNKDLNSSAAYTTAGTRSGLGGPNGRTSVTNYGVEWLTSCGSGEYISNVQLAVMENDNIVILYELSLNNSYQGVYFLLLDDQGNVLSPSTLVSATARLNPCRTPVVCNGRVSWVGNKTDDGSGRIYVYSMDPQDMKPKIELTRNGDGLWYTVNGQVDRSFTGLYTNDDGTWYIREGRLAEDFTGCDWVNGEYCEFLKGQLTTWKKDATVVDPKGDGNWVSMRYGKVDMTYTGIAENANGFWYINNGVLDLTYTDLVTNDYGTWFIYKGQLANWRTGCDWVNGGYYEFVEGQLTTWKKDATVVDPKGDGNWVSMRYGRIDMSYTGIAENENGFWYVKNGKLDLTYTDLVTNDYGTWFIYKGQLANWRTGCDWVNGGYYEFVEGQLTTWKKDATVVDPKGDGNWVSMRYGRIDMSYTGIAENENGFWYIKDGKLDLTFTGLVKNDYGTWFIYLGQLANWRTGIDTVNGKQYYFVEAQLGDWFSGDYIQDNVIYHVVNGVVTGTN